MDNICYEKLDKFKHITPSFKRFAIASLRCYQYDYNVKVQTFNTCEKTYLSNHFAAFKRTTSTQWRDLLFDYTQMVEDCINNNWSLDGVFNMFLLSSENKAKIYCIETLTEKAIQDIINKNIAAFNRLNSYINDLFLLKDMNL